MEGTYFHGEHLRWNLGWENPNPAGAFVAMGLPWLWALASVAGRRSEPSWRAVALTAFLGELAVWFLLCKTYSRGALVAVVVAGAVYLGIAWMRGDGRRAIRMALLRGLAVVALLGWTGFFSRIDPGFVVADASATNRLTLWEGGMQMIAASPWAGWGADKSGTGFMHWFQPLDAHESYAGMVNSYLHVAVERGLPVLGAVLAIVLSLLVLAWIGIRRSPVDRAGWVTDGLAAASCCLLVFLIANVFSTLWIFANLWWLPLFAALGIVGLGFGSMRDRFPRVAGTSVAAGTVISVVAGGGLWLAGRGINDGTAIQLRDDGAVICHAPGGSRMKRVVLLPDSSVLGETWGKEVRRLAASDPSLEILVVGDRLSDPVESGVFDGLVIACGGRAEEGLGLLRRSPEARLVLLHPLGRPDGTGVGPGEVRLVLPGLDILGSGRRWRSAARRLGWKCVESKGVGQDVRLVWPEVLRDVVSEPVPSLSSIADPSTGR